MLFIAAGGPGDLIAADALARKLATESRFATFLWERSARAAGPIQVESVNGLARDHLGSRATARTQIAGSRIQLSDIARRMAGDTYVLDADSLGVAQASIESLLAADADGRIAVVDAGGDVLGQRQHSGLRSPLLEAAVLSILSDMGALAVSEVVVVGPGLDNELTVTDIDSRRSALTPGSDWESSTQGEAEDLLLAFAGIDSETSRLWLHALLGLRGRIWCDSTGYPVMMTDRSAEVISVCASEVHATGPAALVPSGARSIRNVNDALTSAGYVDELFETSSRPVFPPEGQREQLRRQIRPGDHVTERFASRFGVHGWAALRPIGSPVLRVEGVRHG